ncbi:unnamed protein product, partial [Porites evermanni]
SLDHKLVQKIKETRQSDKSPVERNTQQRRIEVRYMAFVFHLHQESKAL